MPLPQTSTPSPGLNVIALISGGKDSLYSILHCIRNGHKVVALANLHPEQKAETSDDHNQTNEEFGQNTSGDDDEKDIDSFMYQTIGHSVIPLYETALGIPLYRAPITGGAVDTARIYRHDAADQAAEHVSPTGLTGSESNSSPGSDLDETESLVPLLRRIMQAHPEANAVSAGAILSTYQRTRIENVAGRLGLVPLAWLWMYPSLPAPVERAADPAAVAQAGLLEDMAACGCDARIIKVASGGLDDGFLWENVSGSGPEAGVRRRLVKGMSRFAAAEDIRGAVLGEGGEYETLALDGPGFLWKGRIEVEEREDGVGEGGVAFVKLKGAKCVDKVKDGEREEVRPEDVRRPALLDGLFATALEGFESVSLNELGSTVSGESTLATAWSIDESSHRLSPSTWTISNLIAPEAGPGADEQMNAIVNKVQHALSSPPDSISTPRSTDDIVFATVLLRSMSDFALMNQVYVSLFKKPNPPARVTVACGDTLPANVRVMVSFVIDRGARDKRQGLHVQSRSYWAPANIGPYSQAMSIPLQDEGRLVYIAGQIPLEPYSMDVAAQGQPWFEGYCTRAVLALQHLWRIGEAMQVDWWLGAVAFMTGGAHVQAQVRIAWELWKKMHTRPVDDEDEDEGPQLDAWDIKYGRRAEELIPQAVESSLPKFSVLDEDSELSIPPFLAVEVDELPRGSDIEWQGLGSRCQQATLMNLEDGTSTMVDGKYSYQCVEIDAKRSKVSLEERLCPLITSYCQASDLSQAVLYTTLSVPEGFWPGQIVPCRSVWGLEGRRLTAAMVLQEERGLDV
jgi:diphthine-ammonia ligase